MASCRERGGPSRALVSSSIATRPGAAGASSLRAVAFTAALRARSSAASTRIGLPFSVRSHAHCPVVSDAASSASVATADGGAWVVSGSASSTPRSSWSCGELRPGAARHDKGAARETAGGRVEGVGAGRSAAGRADRRGHEWTEQARRV